MTYGRGVGAGVDAREELAVLECPRPLTPLVTVAELVVVVAGIGDGLLTPQDPPTCFGVVADLGLPREGKSPSERKFGGVEGFRGRLAEDEERWWGEKEEGGGDKGAFSVLESAAN
jgi:hypothetical protein